MLRDNDRREDPNVLHASMELDERGGKLSGMFHLEYATNDNRGPRRFDMPITGTASSDGANADARSSTARATLRLIPPSNIDGKTMLVQWYDFSDRGVMKNGVFVLYRGQ
jgi:hypothetical protein